MENILAMGSGYQMANEKLEELKGGSNLERSIKLNNDAFEISIIEDKANKLSLIFKDAKSKIEKALIMKDVERDIEKAKEFYSYGSFIG